MTPDEPLEPGDRLALSWTGFQPGEQVTVVMRSTPVTLGTFPADAAGTVTAAVRLPDGAEAGAHTLTFSGPASGDLVVLPFRVAAAAEPAAPEPAPAAATAPDDAALLSWLIGGGLAAVLLATGGIAVQRGRGAAGGQATATPIAEPMR